MVNPVKSFKELHIHFEKPMVVLKRSIIAAVVIVVTSAAVFGIDTAVTSVMNAIG